MNAILKWFFELSEFPEEANKRERYNLDDVEGLEVSYSLSRSERARSMPVFSARIDWGGGGIMCYIRPLY